MKVRAYAKINLGLHILGKRSDGYHNIETIFRLINLYDELDLVQSDQGIQFTSNIPDLANDSTNLCIRAANLLRDLTGCHTGVEMTLIKRIPLGAGLGGGSSDAAAVLKGLTKLWSLEITPDELQTISGTLGSDVPFFFTGQTASATGRGEILERLEILLPYTILVVTPKIHVSTAWAYSHVRVDPGKNRPDLKTFLSGNIGNAAALRRGLVNDFEDTVFGGFPEIRQIKETMLAEGADVALMSGSGSSVFAFFSKSPVAADMARRFSDRYFTSVTEPHFKPEIN